MRLDTSREGGTGGGGGVSMSVEDMDTMTRTWDGRRREEGGREVSDSR